MKKFLTILIFLIPVFLLAAEPIREWKSKTGKVIISAAWDSESDTDPEKVYLKKDGKRYRLPLVNLSEADQRYVSEVREKGHKRGVEEDFGLEEVTENSTKGMTVVPSGNRYALLIGVNNYAKPIQPLRFCKRDMEVLAESFQKSGFPKENIVLMTDDSEVERRPTGANICRQLEYMARLMTSDDMLIVAFSGHGTEAGDNKNPYLCPCDADLQSVKSLVSRDWAFSELERCKAKQKIFLIDACRNQLNIPGAKTSHTARTMQDPTGAKNHGFLLIASCDTGQISWEDPNLEQGVFSYFFAEGLRGNVQDEEGYVSIWSLCQYVSRKTKMHVFQHYNAIQVPTLKLGGEMTDFYLAKHSPTSSSPSSSSPSSSSPSSSSPSVPSSLGRTAGERMVKTVDGVEFAFRWCPPGSFMMGSPESEEERDDDETQHEVTLTHGFWMLETEVTQAQWELVMGNNPSYFHKGGSGENFVSGDNARHPVEHVNWEECQAFCKKLSATMGITLSLPTEAQWEYACRAGTRTAYSFGDSPDDLYRHGNYADASCTIKLWKDNSHNDGHAVTAPAGIYVPNPWGLYDMHGNVGEWCLDWSGDYPEGSVTDPTGPSSGTKRVVRGGVWLFSARECRSASRGVWLPTNISYLFGFRMVYVP